MQYFDTCESNIKQLSNIKFLKKPFDLEGICTLDILNVLLPAFFFLLQSA